MPKKAEPIDAETKARMKEAILDPPSSLCIRTYFHCTKCIEELPAGVSPREWGQLEVGMTHLGLQVWCKRHEINVAHFDLRNERVLVDYVTKPKGNKK